MPTATSDDVEDEISTSLSSVEITKSIQSAADLNEEFNTPTNQSTIQTRKIEVWGAIINIRQFKERSVSEDSIGGASSTFEGDELAAAKAQLASWLDAAGEDDAMLRALETTRTDTNRYVTSSG